MGVTRIRVINAKDNIALIDIFCEIIGRCTGVNVGRNRTCQRGESLHKRGYKCEKEVINNKSKKEVHSVAYCLSALSGKSSHCSQWCHQPRESETPEMSTKFYFLTFYCVNILSAVFLAFGII